MKKHIKTIVVCCGILATMAPAARAGWMCILGCEASYATSALGCGVAGDMLNAGCVWDRTHGGTNDQFLNCEAGVGDFVDECLYDYQVDLGICKDNCKSGS